MGTAIAVKRRFGAADLRRRACASQDTDQARRLLALAAVLDGQSRGAAARIGGMDRQTLRDWVHAYNAEGPNGLLNATSPGRPPKLTKAQKEKLRPIIVAGPDPVRDGVVRWHCVDLKRVINALFECRERHYHTLDAYCRPARCIGHQGRPHQPYGRRRLGLARAQLARSNEVSTSS